MSEVISTPKLYIAPAGAVVRFWSLLHRAAIASFQDGCFGIAKGAAYSCVLSFFPILTTVATVLVQTNAEAVARVVTRLLFDVIPPGTDDVVRDIFKVGGRQPISLLVAAILLSAWAGSGVMISLMEGFRAIYRIPGSRSLLKERAMAMLLVFVAAIPVLGASALIVVGNRARADVVGYLGLVERGSDLRGWVQLAGQAVTFFIATATIVLVTSLVYYFGPNRKQRLSQVLPGAVVTTTLWLIATLAVAWYVREISNYNVLYGGVGAGLALLVWSYVLAVIILIGCEYNAVREGSPR